jgi:hypothetical protein
MIPCDMLERRPLRLAALSVVLVPAGLLAGRLLMSGVNIPYMDQWEVADLVVKAFDGTLSLGDLTSYPNLEALTYYATRLDRHGLLSPGLCKSLSIEPDELRQTEGIGECGWFELLQRTAGETYIAKGWTMLTHRREPADGIILVYEEADGSFTIFDLAMVQRVRPALAQAFR